MQPKAAEDYANSIGSPHLLNTDYTFINTRVTTIYIPAFHHYDRRAEMMTRVFSIPLAVLVREGDEVTCGAFRSFGKTGWAADAVALKNYSYERELPGVFAICCDVPTPGNAPVVDEELRVPLPLPLSLTHPSLPFPPH